MIPMFFPDAPKKSASSSRSITNPCQSSSPASPGPFQVLSWMTMNTLDVSSLVIASLSHCFCVEPSAVFELLSALAGFDLNERVSSWMNRTRPQVKV